MKTWVHTKSTKIMIHKQAFACVQMSKAIEAPTTLVNVHVLEPLAFSKVTSAQNLENYI